MAAAGAKPGPRILGLTGPIACGKTTVGDLLLELGAIERIDADRVVHELMGPGSETTRRIWDLFGDDILSPEGGIDRRRLGELVFGSADALRRLESVVHPAVRTEIRARVERLRDTTGVVVIDAVKLLQSELLELADAVWVVTCSPQAQMTRLINIRGMTTGAAEARLAAMPSFSDPKVTLVIENSGSLEELKSRVRAAWESLPNDWAVPHLGAN